MTKRVLYVDDEPDIREIAVLSLQLDPGLEVRSCSSGEEALKVAPEWLPDLILLDVMMPFMDGPSTLSRLRENSDTQDIPIVFVTARAQASESEKLLSMGARGVISKPFDPMALAGDVRSFLN